MTMCMQSKIIFVCLFNIYILYFKVCYLNTKVSLHLLPLSLVAAINHTNARLKLTAWYNLKKLTHYKTWKLEEASCKSTTAV